jgi:hypothetical protein
MSATDDVQIIPAQPGWSVIKLNAGAGDIFQEHPIIGWRIVTEQLQKGQKPQEPIMTVYAITTEGVHDDDWLGAILRPDGRVRQPGAQLWNTKQEFCEEVRKRSAQRTKRLVRPRRRRKQSLGITRK